MKRMFFALLIVAVLISGFAEAADKFACVDLEQVFNEYQKTKDEEAKLTKIGEEKQKDIDSKLKEVDRLKEKMDLLSDKEKEKVKVELDQKMEELRQFDRQVRTDLMRQRNEIIEGILQEINEVVEDYSKSKKYTIMFNSRALLYKNNDLDVTKELIEYLNKQYK
ncbi:MAG: OmpH family outer membrane protein [Candidatus Kaelpia aquatica]|nr:OmpH family outer membrane protein [Candidatus Kaelpia aquatica]